MAMTEHSLSSSCQSDARDKVGKFLQNFCRLLAWRLAEQGSNEPSKKYAAVAKSLGEYRSLLKFFKVSVRIVSTEFNFEQL